MSRRREGAATHPALQGAVPAPYWLATSTGRPAQAAETLTGDVPAGLAVVGGGFTGLWSALLAKERSPDLEVVLLEAREVGWAASGRNGGFCAASLTHGLRNGLDRWPDEMAVLERLGRENLDAIEETVDRLGIDCGFERTGELTVATADWQLEEMRDLPDAAARFGGKVELLTGEEVRERIHSPTYVGGVLDRDGVAMLDPARLAWGLRDACVAAGVRIVERTPVHGVERSADGRLRLRTTYGVVTADRVALGTGALSPLLRRLRSYVVPVWDYALVTEPLSPDQRAAIGWEQRVGVSDAGNQFHYYRLTADDRILWGGYDAVYRFGGPTDDSQASDAVTHARLAEHFAATFPQLAGVRFTHAWGGVIDTCTRFSPFWGTAYDGRLGYVAGYTGLGVGSSRFGAQVMLDLLEGTRNERTELTMVRTKPLPFPPEPLRWAGITLTRRALARADSRDGRRGPWLRTLDRLGLGFDS